MTVLLSIMTSTKLDSIRKPIVPCALSYIPTQLFSALIYIVAYLIIITALREPAMTVIMFYF